MRTRINMCGRTSLALHGQSSLMFPTLPGAVMRTHFQIIIAAVAGSLAGFAAPVQSQVPGVPVLQNAFSNPGLAIAANFGGGRGQSFYGAASAWGLAGGRLQLSGAAGAQRANEGTRGAYGG